MKSILIRASGSSGKSTMIREVCRKLNPSKIAELWFREDKSTLIDIDDIFNGTYIVTFDKKDILVVAGSPTEQDVTMNEIIDICKERAIDFSFMLIAMRYFEKKDGFDTQIELEKVSTILEVITDIFIEEKNAESNFFMKDSKWISKLNKIVELIRENV